MMTNRARSILPAALAAAVFLVFAARPLAVSFLRARAARSDPAGWARGPMSGRGAVLLPELFGTRLHDEALYAARARQVLLHGRPISPYGPARADDGSWLDDALEMYLTAGAIALAGGDVDRAWDILAPVLAAAWFLAIFLLLKRWTGRDDAAAPLALAAALLPDASVWLLDVNLHAGVLWTRWRDVFFGSGAAIGPIFHRLPSPLLSYFLLAGLLAGAWRLAVEDESRPVAAAALGAGFGLLTLVHPYEWSFGLAALAAFAAAAFVPGWCGRGARRNLLVAVGAALAVSAAYAALIAASVPADLRRGSLAVIGVQATRRFNRAALIHPLVAALAAALALCEPSPRRRAAYVLLACAQLAAFAAREAQVVFGFAVQPFHYIPLAGAAGGVLLLLAAADALARAPFWGRKAAAAAGALLLALALGEQLRQARACYRLLGLPPGLEAGLAWLDAHAPADSLVLTPSMEADLAVSLRTRARGWVPTAFPPLASSFTEEGYCRIVGRMIGALDLDADRFLSERFLIPAARDAREARLVEDERRGVLDPAAWESVEWFHPLRFDDPGPGWVLEDRARIKAFAASAPPVPRPFYAWIDARDRVYLRRPLAELGGQAVYRAADVEIDLFR